MINEENNPLDEINDIKNTANKQQTGNIGNDVPHSNPPERNIGNESAPTIIEETSVAVAELEPIEAIEEIKKPSIPDYVETDLMGVTLTAPLYMVVTPHTNCEFHIKSMSLMHEEALKTSFVSRQMLTKMLSKSIFDNIVIKPDHIKNYQDFIENITLNDEVALLYGLYHTSYGELSNLNVSCPECKKSFETSIQTAGLMHFDPYPGEDYIYKRHTVELNSGFKAVLRPVTVKAEIEYLEEALIIDNEDVDDLSEYMLMIDHFIHPSGKEIRGTLDKFLILSAMGTGVGKKLKKENEEAFKGHGIEFHQEIQCNQTACGKKFKVEVDLLDQFFRMVQG